MARDDRNPELGTLSGSMLAERAQLPPDHPDAETWRRLCDLVDNHYGSTFEMFARFVAIAIGASVVSYVTQDSIPLIWGAAYLVSVVLIWLYMRGIKAPGTRHEYRMSLALDMVQSLIFITIVPYAASVATPASAVAPFAVVAGYAIYNIARNTPIPLIVAWEAALMVVAVIWSCLLILDNFGATPETLGAMAIKVIVVIYAALVSWDVLRRTLQERTLERRALAAQRVEAVGQLTAGLAHEFNNILTGIQGHLDLAELDPNPKSRAESLAFAKEGTQRAAGHIRQLLSFARKAAVDSEPRELNTLMRRSLPLFESLLGMKRLFAIESDAPVLGAMVDPAAMESAVANLVLNARDADARHVILRLGRVIFLKPERITSELTLLPGNYAAISCIDDGPGIPADVRNKVSEPFFTTKAPGDGTGLGLSMVRGTAEQMGGALLIGSSESGGAEITILLPECAVEMPVAAQEKPATYH
ncbi:MAG: ATP-binding protein [Pseudomonadota bacterium]